VRVKLNTHGVYDYNYHVHTWDPYICCSPECKIEAEKREQESKESIQKFQQEEENKCEDRRSCGLCAFNRFWSGFCSNTENGTGFCDEHSRMKCRCGRQAERELDDRGWPVCAHCADFYDHHGRWEK